MSPKNVFLYGTLRDPELLRIVAGEELSGSPAQAPGYWPRSVEGKAFPVLVESQHKSCEGILVTVSSKALERLAFYEYGYVLESINVTQMGETHRALTFLPDAPDWVLGPEWHFDDWVKDTFQVNLGREMATEAMRLMPNQTPAQIHQFWHQVKARAATRLTAAANPSPTAFEPDLSTHPVQVKDTRQPYSQFFAVREDDLAFPRFDGTQSPVLRRACFIGGDAVTVLPFDPITDKVLLIRQFRHGPFARGDTNPWTLEPVAGRIDPGETPETTARRELAEETEITAIGPLHEVSRHYPSPGAYTEFLFSYVAETNLAGIDGRVAGVEGEAEDIMSHVIPFEQAMEMIATGAANTGPLVLSLQWIALNKDRFGQAS